MIKNLVCALLLLFLSSCNITPLYKANQENYDLLTQVNIKSVQGEKDYILRHYLDSALNPNNIKAQKRFDLDISVTQSAGGTLVQRDSTVTDTDMIIVANFSLKSIKDNKEIKSGRIQVVTNFEDALSSYASFSQKNKAYDNALKEIVRSIKSYILVALLNKNYITNENPS